MPCSTCKAKESKRKQRKGVEGVKMPFCRGAACPFDAWKRPCEGCNRGQQASFLCLSGRLPHALPWPWPANHSHAVECVSKSPLVCWVPISRRRRGRTRGHWGFARLSPSGAIKGRICASSQESLLLKWGAKERGAAGHRLSRWAHLVILQCLFVASQPACHWWAEKGSKEWKQGQGSLSFAKSRRGRPG